MDESAPVAADHVAIVGGGFSGTLLAINLVRHAGPRATLIERRPHAARGVAYSTIHAEHLLNVRAGNMSALPDEPDHFVRWLEARGHATGFAPRRLYGDYLADLLAEAAARAPGRLTLVRGEAVDLDAGGVRLADGGVVSADAVALAIGNLPPLAPGGIDVQRLPPGAYVEDPWGQPIAGGLGRDDAVVVLGTGLTMVDVALLLDADGFEGRVLALSRRGLTPRAHGDAPPSTLAERPPPAARALVRAVRERAAGRPWRSAIDELRPYTQGLWGAMSLDERARFLRHVRAWWDVHRHRIAPQVAAKLDAMRRAGRLEIAAGRVVEASSEGDGVRLRWRPRGREACREIVARRLVNATGPQGDLARSREPLLCALVAKGAIRPDPLGIGVDVDRRSRAIAADGSASDRLIVLGPMTRGAFWEIVAVPDIRRQVWSVARRLARAEWVEGEGL